MRAVELDMVPALAPLPAGSRRRAALRVCAMAGSPEAAGPVLAALGLIEEPPRQRRKSHEHVSPQAARYCATPGCGRRVLTTAARCHECRRARK